MSAPGTFLRRRSGANRAPVDAASGSAMVQQRKLPEALSNKGPAAAVREKKKGGEGEKTEGKVNERQVNY